MKIIMGYFFVFVYIANIFPAKDYDKIVWHT